MLTGNLKPELLRPLAERYLASIPVPPDAAPPRPLTAVTPLPVRFPQTPVVEDVHVDMVSPITQVRISNSPEERC